MSNHGSSTYTPLVGGPVAMAWDTMVKVYRQVESQSPYAYVAEAPAERRGCWHVALESNYPEFGAARRRPSNPATGRSRPPWISNESTTMPYARTETVEFTWGFVATDRARATDRAPRIPPQTVMCRQLHGIDDPRISATPRSPCPRRTRAANMR